VNPVAFESFRFVSILPAAMGFLGLRRMDGLTCFFFHAEDNRSIMSSVHHLAAGLTFLAEDSEILANRTSSSTLLLDLLGLP
jgi:hypothetical protein